MSNEKNRNERTVVTTMIKVYCRAKGHSGPLCGDCAELLAYSLQRIEACPFSTEKPFCSRCQIHCYEPHMRWRIRQVMRFSGPRMLLYQPLTALRHLLGQLKRVRGE